MSEQLLSARSEWPAVDDQLPDTMTAVVFEEFGAPEVLQMAQLSTPRPGPGEVVVRVAAVSVGRLLDLTARAGTHPYARFTLPHVLGAEHAGTIAAVGAGVDAVSVGDHVAVFPVLSCGHCAACSEGAIEACPEARIMGVHVQGAYAQYTVVPAENVFRVPDGLDPTASAALALAGPVAQNQFDQAGLQARRMGAGAGRIVGTGIVDRRAGGVQRRQGDRHLALGRQAKDVAVPGSGGRAGPRWTPASPPRWRS